MKLYYIVCFAIFIFCSAFSQHVAESSGKHVIPFASSNNAIELAVTNTSSISTSNVVVAVTNAPQWLKFAENEQKLTKLSSQSISTTRFVFSVDKSAPVNKLEQVTFTITNSNGEHWTKTLSLQVSPPTTYELFQNYPNPFNPTTVISYQLPGAVGTRFKVSLKVYDMLGREVTALANEMQEPGYYQKTFDANRYASGMYIYRLLATDEQNNHHVFQKKMLMVK